MQSNSLITSTLIFNVLRGAEISVHHGACRVQPLSAELILWISGHVEQHGTKKWGSVHIWTPSARKWGPDPTTRTLRPHRIAATDGYHNQDTQHLWG